MAELRSEARADERTAFGLAPVPELHVEPSSISAVPYEAPQRAPTIVTIAAAVVGLIAAIVLIGWSLDIQVLKSVLPNLATMRGNTAFGLGFSAGALWLSRTKISRERHSLMVWILLAMVSLIAVLTLCEYALQWNAGIDQLIFRDREHLGTLFPAGRLAPGTAFCFLTLAGAFWFLDARPRLSDSLIVVTAFVSLVGLIGYIYELPTLYGAGRYTTMALNTVVSFLALCVGLVASRPKRGVAALLVDSRAQGSNLHLLLTGAVLLPVVSGAVALQLQRLGWYGNEVTLALFSVILMALSVTLVWVTGAQRRQTEAKRYGAEKALRESEERLRTMADNIPNLAWIAHADGYIFWYNKRWFEYTGRTQESMQAWGWQKVHDPQVLPSVLEGWKNALATGMPFEMVFPLRGADGVFRPFLTRVQPIRGQDGRVERWFGTNTDISAERKVQEELRKSNRELEEYAYVSSHDLQEPLRMVHIYTQLLMRDLGAKLDERTTQYAFYVQNGVTRMQELIQDLLQFSRMVNNAPINVSSTPTTDLDSCLQRALDTLEGRIGETHASIVVASQLPSVRGEEKQLTQVFHNLLSNCLKYRKENEPPRIEISAREEHGEWITCVQDNGIGFEPQYAERIFGLFKRLHKQEYPGSGLGLTICQRTIERYGGRMWAEGELGKGATFYFALPGAEAKS